MNSGDCTTYRWVLHQGCVVANIMHWWLLLPGRQLLFEVFPSEEQPLRTAVIKILRSKRGEGPTALDVSLFHMGPADSFVLSNIFLHSSFLSSSIFLCIHFLMSFSFLFKYRDSSVGIALGYGLDDRGPRVRFPEGAGSFSLHHRVQNGSGAHPTSYTMGSSGRDVKLTTHLHLVPRSKNA
jgi:hypothetical protein